MANKSRVRLMVEHWVRKVLTSFIICVAILFCLSIFIQEHYISEEYMAIALLLCCAYYLYQIFLITKIKCPKCRKVLIFSLFTEGFPLRLKNYDFKKCNNCGKEFE
jgi:uncharacterized membrane protein YbhN (UPF0104 family)